VDYVWERYMLPLQQETTKIAAVNCYTSQLKMMKGFLESFDRINELFIHISIPTLPIQSKSSLPAPYLTGGGMSYYEPGRETSRLLMLPGADIIGWQIERQGDLLSFVVIMNGKLTEAIHYMVYLKTPDGLTHKYPYNQSAEAKASTSFTTQVSLTDLNSPPVLSFSAETRQDVVLDSSAWEFILVNYPPTTLPTASPH
jgi:hypothetical protein